MRIALLLATLVLLGACLGACLVAEPRLYPLDPPPNQAAGMLLLQVPASTAGALAKQTVMQEVQLVVGGRAAELGYADLTPGHAEHIAEHRVVTGMNQQEVIWCFRSHPTRVRNQGPPGSFTYLWEAPGLFHDRYWVRFDENGVAASAGTY